MKLKHFKKTWIKYVKIWNEFVIQAFLIIIWVFILTPTALIRRVFLKLFSSQPKKLETFFKKSDTLNDDHFLRPF